MLVLAIDTALDACAAAVYDAAADRIVSSISEDIGRGHAERLMSVLAAVMSRAGIGFDALDRIAVTIGPGSFTGIRVGVATARGLALAAGRPIVGVNTLQALTAGAAVDGAVMAAIDARRGEVYAGVVQHAGAGLLGDPAIMDLQAAADRAIEAGAALIGSGAGLVADAASKRLEPVPFGSKRSERKGPAQGLDSGAIPYRSNGPIRSGNALDVCGLDRFPAIEAVARIGARSPLPGAPPVPLYIRAADAAPQHGGRVARLSSPEAG